MTATAFPLTGPQQFPRAKSAPCKRHRRGELAGWIPVDTRNGKVWAIAESHFCKNCGASMEPRLVKGTIKRTQRAAMEAYGLPAADIAAFFPEPTPEPGDRPAMALSCWPFPVSTRYAKGATP